MIQKKFLWTCISLGLLASSTTFAKQSLQAALQQNPKLDNLYEAVKASSGVDCVPVDSFPTTKITGPEGKMAVTHQVACFDPVVFNPTQLGQLFVTYYGDGEKDDSAVGAVIEIKFEVFK